MNNTDLYEKLRILMGWGINDITLGSNIALPRNEATRKFLMNLYNEEEAHILTKGFEFGGQMKSLEDISKSVGIPEEELEKKLDDIWIKGKLGRPRDKQYVALSWWQTGFNYFLIQNEDPEKMNMVGKALLRLMNKSGLNELSAGDYSRFRVIPSVKQIEKTIEVNKTIEVEKVVLPFEYLTEFLSSYEDQNFYIMPCTCREAASKAGETCRKTDGKYCIAAGEVAKAIGPAIEGGIIDGRKASVEEVVNILKKAEEEGLVHQTANIQNRTSLICNCCSCCCPYLRSYKKLGQAGATVRSNFDPIRDRELCQLCGTCEKICPMNAIERHWPHKADGSDDFIDWYPNRCIGCGLCASNCPNQAISLKKVRDFIPVQTFPELLERIKESIEH